MLAARKIMSLQPNTNLHMQQSRPEPDHEFHSLLHSHARIDGSNVRAQIHTFLPCKICKTQSLDTMHALQAMPVSYEAVRRGAVTTMRPMSVTTRISMLLIYRIATNPKHARYFAIMHHMHHNKFPCVASQYTTSHNRNTTLYHFASSSIS